MEVRDATIPDIVSRTISVKLYPASSIKLGSINAIKFNKRDNALKAP
jgi:hypothetical protein